MKYISHFFSLNCAHDILPFFVGCKDRAAKEVTESFGMLHAALDEFGDLKDWVIICVGDGKRPRTGATFRFTTKAHWVYSVDPASDIYWFEATLPKKFGVSVKKMSVFPYKAEHMPKIDCEGKPCLMVMCHSHSNLSDDLAIPINYSRLSAISMPCCKHIPPRYLEKDFAKKTGLKTYVDGNITSPKNQLFIWPNLS